MRHIRIVLLLVATAAFSACTSTVTGPTAHDCSGYTNPNGLC